MLTNRYSFRLNLRTKSCYKLCGNPGCALFLVFSCSSLFRGETSAQHALAADAGRTRHRAAGDYHPPRAQTGCYSPCTGQLNSKQASKQASPYQGIKILGEQLSELVPSETRLPTLSLTAFCRMKLAMDTALMLSL